MNRQATGSPKVNKSPKAQNKTHAKEYTQGLLKAYQNSVWLARHIAKSPTGAVTGTVTLNGSVVQVSLTEKHLKELMRLTKDQLTKSYKFFSDLRKRKQGEESLSVFNDEILNFLASQDFGPAYVKGEDGRCEQYAAQLREYLFFTFPSFNGQNGQIPNPLYGLFGKKKMMKLLSLYKLLHSQNSEIPLQMKQSLPNLFSTPALSNVNKFELNTFTKITSNTSFKKATNDQVALFSSADPYMNYSNSRRQGVALPEANLTQLNKSVYDIYSNLAPFNQIFVNNGITPSGTNQDGSVGATKLVVSIIGKIIGDTRDCIRDQIEASQPKKPRPKKEKGKAQAQF